MHLTKTTFRFAVVAGLALVTGHLKAGEHSAVKAMKAEVANRGWVVFAAHPAEIDDGAIIKNKGQRGHLDLYLSRPGRSQLRNITNTKQYSEFGGRFSPDNTKLLYRRLPKGEKINHDLWGETGELVIADADGCTRKPVAASVQKYLPLNTRNKVREMLAERVRPTEIAQQCGISAATVDREKE